MESSDSSSWVSPVCSKLLPRGLDCIDFKGLGLLVTCLDEGDFMLGLVECNGEGECKVLEVSGDENCCDEGTCNTLCLFFLVVVLVISIMLTSSSSEVSGISSKTLFCGTTLVEYSLCGELDGFNFPWKVTVVVVVVVVVILLVSPGDHGCLAVAYKDDEFDEAELRISNCLVGEIRFGIEKDS